MPWPDRAGVFTFRDSCGCCFSAVIVWNAGPASKCRRTSKFHGQRSHGIQFEPTLNESAVRKKGVTSSGVAFGYDIKVFWLNIR